MSPSMDRQYVKNGNERMTDVAQILSDKAEKVAKVQQQITSQENDLEKDTLLDLQKKMAEAFKIKREIPGSRMTWKMLSYWIHKILVKILTKTVCDGIKNNWRKIKSYNNYLIKLKIKVVRNKKEYEFGLFDQT